MIFDAMFLQNDVLGLSMQAASVRQEVISNNIANVDTPGFKSSSVLFENFLQAALNKTDGLKVADAADYLSIKPVVNTPYSNFDYRIDANNVDIESEMTNLYVNGAKYDTLASGVINNYKRLNEAITGIK